MAQHDYVIDNATGANVRGDINDALLAISSNNSGTSAPSTTYATQFFADTNAGIMKLRNTSNNAYVNLFTLAGGIDVDAASTFSEDVTYEGASANVVFDKSDNAFEFADNAKAVFGANSDLIITHDTTDSTITSATNDLKIISNGDDLILEAEDDVIIRDNGGSNILAQFINGGANELYHNATKKFETASGGVSLTGGAAANITAADVSSSTVTLNMASSCHHTIAMDGNKTLAAPSNQAVGQSGSIIVTQDSSGSHTLQFNTAFKFTGGSAPTLTTTAGAVDRIDYLIVSSNVIHCAVSLDVKQGS